MSDKFNGIRLEFHILQSFPVSCLNRDDLGSPKSAIVGGTPRARVSSQCWKRAVRMQMHELGVQLASRTKYVVQAIAEKCQALGASPEQARQCGEIFAKAVIENKDKKKNTKDGESEPEKNTDDKNKTLFFLSDSEAEALALTFQKKNFEVEMKASSKEEEKLYEKIIKELIKELQKKCKDALNPAHDGLDIALFGRMVANAADMNVEAAASFAHAISTHRVDPEIDFFTAVDDCKKDDESGSAYMGSLEFNSATYYRYVSLDLGQLARTLKTDEILPAVKVFTQALFLAVPGARQATMSAANPWNYALITIRRGQCMQLPFNTAVRTSAKNPDLVANSIEALKERFEAAERMYGSLFGLLAKFELSLEQGSIDELTDGISDTISTL